MVHKDVVLKQKNFISLKVIKGTLSITLLTFLFLFFFVHWNLFEIHHFRSKMRIAIISLLIAALEFSLALPTKDQANVRASLITKDNYAAYLEAQRNQKALDAVPKPFIVSTSLNIRENNRKSRTWFDEKDGAIVIEGERWIVLISIWREKSPGSTYIVLLIKNAYLKKKILQDARWQVWRGYAQKRPIH